MTRGVRWDTDQRVDLPDVLALQDLRLQDARRAYRHLLLGKDAQAGTRVIRGFKVEPEGPPSSRVVVNMDLGIDGQSTFLGAEARGGGKFERGALGGGKDANDNLEGSALATLDFAPKANAVYTVKVRLVLNTNTGIADNRAFWNPGLNIEQIRVTDTRFLPQWEIAFENHADPDWVTLADVNWTGGTISASDITDRRDFAIEGTPNPTATVAEQYTHASQDAATNDYARDDDRGDPTVGMAGIWETLRALARQVQDIKGARETDNRFDWFSRVYAPAGFRTGSVPKADEITKTLRTLETATFTVADGATDSADFSGASALYDCFKFIEDNEAELPPNINIVVRDRVAPGPPTTFTWDLPVTINDKFVDVKYAQGGNSDTLLANPGAYGAGEGQMQIVSTVAQPNAALSFTGIGGLSMTNIGWSSAGRLLLIDTDRRCYLQATNCSIIGVGDIDETEPQLRCGHERLLLDRCFISGTAFIGGRNARSVEPLDLDLHHTGGVVRNSSLDGLVRLRHELGVPASAQIMQFAQGIRFEHSTFTVTFDPYNAEGQIDARGARRIVFDGCHIAYNGNQDGIRLGDFDWNGGNEYVTSSDITARSCTFKLAQGASHANGAGLGGGFGTGWAIVSKVVGVPGPSGGFDQIPKNIHIKGCKFNVANYIGGPFIRSSTDAGAIGMYDSRNVRIEDNEIREWTQPFVADTNQAMIRVQGTIFFAGVGGGQQTWIKDNFIGDWFESVAGDTWGVGGAAGDGQLHAIQVNLANGVFVDNNYITALAADGTFIAPNANDFIVEIIDSLSVHFSNNTYAFWKSALNAALTDVCVGFKSLFANDITFDHDSFLQCGANNVDVASGGPALTGVVFDSCRFLVGQDSSQWNSCVNFTAAPALTSIHWKNNYWDYTAIGVNTAIFTGPVIVGSCTGNYFRSGDIAHPSFAGAAVGTGGNLAFHGYGRRTGGAGQGHTDLNHVNAYT